VLDDSPDTVASTPAGVTYAASAWVRAPAGRSVTVRLRELRSGALVRSTVATLTADGGWKQLSVTSRATAGGTSLSLEVVVSLARGTHAQVDDVSLKRA
jgi:hypothetical protein